MKSDDLSLLTVQSDGRAEMPPDTVVLTWNFLVQRPTAVHVRAELERQGKELLDALRAVGFKAKDLRTGRDSFEEWREYCNGQWERMGHQAERTWFLRFPVASGKLPKVLDALQGFPVPMKVRHELSEQDRLEEESLRLAVLKARRQAELMAAAAGVTLGRLVSLVRGELRIRNSWDSGDDLLCREEAAPAAREIDGCETVTMTWEIVR